MQPQAAHTPAWGAALNPMRWRVPSREPTHFCPRVLAVVLFRSFCVPGKKSISLSFFKQKMKRLLNV